MDIRLMTYNICSGMSYGTDRKRDLAQCAEVIRKYSPDILGLNEVHYNIGFSGSVKQAEELNKILGYEYMYYGKAGAIKEGYQGNGRISGHGGISGQTGRKALKRYETKGSDGREPYSQPRSNNLRRTYERSGHTDRENCNGVLEGLSQAGEDDNNIDSYNGCRRKTM